MARVENTACHHLSWSQEHYGYSSIQIFTSQANDNEDLNRRAFFLVGWTTINGIMGESSNVHTIQEFLVRSKKYIYLMGKKQKTNSGEKR